MVSDATPPAARRGSGRRGKKKQEEEEVKRKREGKVKRKREEEPTTASDDMEPKKGKYSLRNRKKHKRFVEVAKGVMLSLTISYKAIPPHSHRSLRIIHQSASRAAFCQVKIIARSVGCVATPVWCVSM